MADILYMHDEYPPGYGGPNWSARANGQDVWPDFADQPTPPPPPMRDERPRIIKATPFAWISPGQIPARDFVYGKHYVRNAAG
jgi:hypothetical protein